MAQAGRDQNSVTTLIALSNADGTTPVALWADPTTHRLLTSASITPGGSDTQVQFNDGGTIAGDAGLTYNKTTDALAVVGSVSVGGTDAMTINGSSVSTRLALHQADSATAASVEAHQYSNTAGRGAIAYFARSRGTSGTPLVVQSGDTLGQIDAVGYDGTDYALAASIEFEVDGTPGSNDMPGRIVFKTSPDGSQTLATALTIASDKSATFVGTVTMPTPFTLGAVSVTTTGTQLNYLNGATGTTGTTSTNIVFSTSPTLVTPTLGVASATSINKVAITAPASSATLTIADGKTLTVNNSIAFGGTDATTMTFPTTSATIARTDAGQTFTGVQAMTSPDITTSITTPSTTFSLVNATATTVNFAGAATTMAIGASTALITVAGNIIHSNNAIAASGNAATVPITHRVNTVTNNSAATLTITMTTTSAVDGQLSLVRILDASAAAQTITWVNTENSSTSAPTTSNGSTTLPLTVGFQYNAATSKWRCISST